MATDMRQLIAATANSIGISPLDLATAISYETGGTFDPTKRGPTTKWGQHRGLIQFGEPQAKQYGVDWNDPIGSQLGPGKAVARYLTDAGVRPGMGMLDVYSAINAGGVGPQYHGRSDTAAGGAPGSVADKVNNQMAGHRQKAEALLGGAYTGMADGQKGQEMYPPAAPSSPFSFGGGGLLAGQSPINPELAALAGEDEDKATLGGLLSAIGKAIPDAPQPNLGPMPDVRRTGGLLTEFLSNMKRRA